MMDLGRVTRWRDLVSKAGAAFCVIALLAVVDGLLVHFREPSNLFKVLPGEVAGIDGNLTDEAKSVEDLSYESNSDQLKVTFEAIHPGYFLGGDMWRGRLIVGPQISPGEYRLVVKHKRSSASEAGAVFRIMVFPDALSLQQSSPSLIRRTFGTSPFGVAAGCLPGIVLAFGAVFLLSGKRDALLAASGKAEIYQVIRGDGELEIRFALGTAQGMSPGARVAIYNAEGRQVGTATVEVSSLTDSAARATTDQEIKVGYLVCRA
jgi:hypothetical protein